jgi:hypothetical protein
MADTLHRASLATSAAGKRMLMWVPATLCFSMALAGCDSPTKASVMVADRSETSEAIEHSDDELIGEYLCTVARRAALERIHVEDAGPPEATTEPLFGSRPPTRFRIGISRGEGATLHLTELRYAGTDRDQTEWHTPNSVIHSRYSGSGGSFTSAPEDPEAFFVLGSPVGSHADGNREFYHSGFAWAGGEDSVVSVRWGRCKKT